MPEKETAPGRHSGARVSEAREALVRWVAEGGAGGRFFLEAHLLATGPGSYRVRHRADVKRPAASLKCSQDPYRARDIARSTAHGDHRPLRTSPNLRRGWSLDDLDARGLWIALEYLYPACAVNWHAERTGTLAITPWAETAGRQSGIYSAVRLLPEAAVRDAVTACCGDAVCLRKVRWPISAAAADSGDAPAAGPADEAVVPCPEACSLFISFARTVLSVEREPRREVRGLGEVSEGELRQIRQIVEDQSAGTGGAAREGEFEIPTNPRRIRYLAARLAAGCDDGHL
jgi:hypothetical protein